MNNKQNNNMSKLESHLIRVTSVMNHLIVWLVFLISMVLIVGSVASALLCPIMYIQSNGDMHSTLAPFLFGVPMAVIGMASLMLYNGFKEQSDKFDEITSIHEEDEENEDEENGW